MLSLLRRVLVRAALSCIGAVSFPLGCIYAQTPATAADASGSAELADPTNAIGQIPALAPSNPTAAARTGLYVQPFVLPHDGWRPAVAVSYASAIEYQQVNAARYLFDAEVLQADLTLARDLNTRVWVSGTIGVAAAFDGRLDGLFDWYHERIGFTMEERSLRPADRFAYSLVVPKHGIARARPRPGPALTDLRLTTGLRWADGVQTALSVTLPTSPSSSLMSRGVATVSVMQTVRGQPHERAIVEGSGGVGYAPRHGELSPIQRELFWLASVSSRIRLFRGHGAYGTLFTHSATYEGTGIRIMDAGELTADFGYAYRWPDGREVRIGLTEDVLRQDQGLDLALRVSLTR